MNEKHLNAGQEVNTENIKYTLSKPVNKLLYKMTVKR